MDSEIQIVVSIDRSEASLLMMNANGQEGEEGVTRPSTFSSKPDIINSGLDDQMTIQGYCCCRWKNILTLVISILSLGLLQLIFYWSPNFKLFCTANKCSLLLAEYVLLKDQYDQIFVERVKQASKKIKSKNLLMKVLFKYHASEIIIDSQTANDSKMTSIRDNKFEDLLRCRYFMNKKIKFIWNNELHMFEKLRGLEDKQFCSFFYKTSGLQEEEATMWRQIYGPNNIVIHVSPILNLLFNQALNPFYIFQLFSITLWFLDHYMYYAICIIIISSISLATQVYQTRSMQRALKHTLSPSDVVSVLRANTENFESLPSDLLTPGDIIEIPRHGCVMQCDAVLISGNCIVNESMLTGESVPVTKTPIPCNTLSSGQDELFSITEHGRHIIFCGTQVIQARFYDNQKVKAVVFRTGFSTAKGELVRSILFPKPVDFKFSQDAFKFVGFLATLALIGMIYTFVLMAVRGSSIKHLIVRALDLVTIVIPPALPAAMTVGIVFAQKRLRQKKIFCISPRSINLCGAIDAFCFDKTGTLTEEGLDFYCVVPIKDANFEEELKSIILRDRHNPVVVAMATCHSLTIIDGRLEGDPLDLKMFQATQWEIEEPGEDTSKYDNIMPTIVHPKNPDLVTESSGYEFPDVLPYEVGILRQFTFSSKLQRMSVITRELTSNHCHCYAKGSPEMIASLCNPKTVPSNFQDILMYYTHQGYRVIALAYKKLQKLSYVKIQRVERDAIEQDLTFLGLMVFENRLKVETSPVIKLLKLAHIRTIMVTGDNILTALSVARDCEMIEEDNNNIIMVDALPPTTDKPVNVQFTKCQDAKRDSIFTIGDIRTVIEMNGPRRVHLAVCGKSWANLRKYYSDMLPKIAVLGTVFARFLPEQKQQLIELLQEVGYFVGMCGDGANDCGALKTAHAGISLSEAESSVASPFTSKEPHIGCVLDVIKEGRAALVTSFGIFKFMAGYSMTQFLSVCLLYWIGANFTDFTFLYVDLVLLTTLGITFCYTEAFPRLGLKPPRVTLISVAPILSIISQLLVNLFFQVLVWKLTAQQPWFEPYIMNYDRDYKCQEVTVVFCISAFQFIIMSIVFTKGPPFRNTIFTNYLFIINLIVVIVLTSYLCIYPDYLLEALLELVPAPDVRFRLLIVGMAIINFFVSFIVEHYLVELLIDEKCLGKLERKWRRSKLIYGQVEKELGSKSDWPPIPTSSNYCSQLSNTLYPTFNFFPPLSYSNSAESTVSYEGKCSPVYDMCATSSGNLIRNSDTQITIVDHDR